MLSTTSAHALRAMAFLATLAPGESMLAKELAQVGGVPLTYLSKILARLTRTGLLTATRGIRGGYRLARPPETIRLCEIIEPFDDLRTESVCIFGTGRPCSDTTRCAMHESWKKVSRGFIGFFERTRLSSISGGSGKRARKSLETRFAARSTAPGGRGKAWA